MSQAAIDSSAVDVFMILVVVVIQCMECCPVLTQGLRTALVPRRHHSEEPELQERRAAYQLPATRRLCVQGVQIRSFSLTLDEPFFCFVKHKIVSKIFLSRFRFPSGASAE